MVAVRVFVLFGLVWEVFVTEGIAGGVCVCVRQQDVCVLFLLGLHHVPAFRSCNSVCYMPEG